ncbi:hypothetical protein L208DRAFT_1382345 [Tricholoma matsutake]|nr:hypothetical protein L208DRAFT_1382345 [Tricholoma matsutake 945]
MALVWGILFSRIMPYLFCDCTFTIDGVGETEITRQIRNMEWVESQLDKQRGCTMPLRYITMSSPLWKEYWNFGFGKAWSDKHGMKQINVVNFVRMGLVKAMTSGILTMPKYSKNWEMLPLEKLKTLYQRVMRYLTSEPQGEFLAVEEVFGMWMATMLVKWGDVKN